MKFNQFLVGMSFLCMYTGSFSVRAFGAEVDDAWDAANSPSIIDGDNQEAHFDALPLSGSVDESMIPWSDTYWPNVQGGIARRWHNPENPAGFKYHLMTRDEAKAASAQAIEMLSPAEKLDIMNGRFDYPTVKKVWSKVSPHDKSWNGICNGWSPASINHREPAPRDMVSADGIRVSFGSSDIKALMSYYYAWVSESPVNFMGRRCSFNHLSFIKSCEDVNAGAFHMVITNRIGIQKKAFIADISRFKEVWNNPVYGFESKIVSRTSKKIVVETKMIYTDELDEPLWQSVIGTKEFQRSEKIYRYSLDLDGEGRIVGGDWLTSDRPDFLWTKEISTFDGDFAVVNKLLE